jgi:hypothetical protein
MADILGDIEREQLSKLRPTTSTKTKKPVIRTKRGRRQSVQKEQLEEEIIEDVYQLPEEELGPKKISEQRGAVIKIPRYSLVNLEKEREKKKKESRYGKNKKYSFKFTDTYDEPKDEEDDDGEKEDADYYSGSDSEEGEEIVGGARQVHLEQEGEEEEGEFITHTVVKPKKKVQEKSKEKPQLQPTKPLTKKMIRVTNVETKFVPYPKPFDKFLKVLGITHRQRQGTRPVQVETTGLVRVVEHEFRKKSEREYFVGMAGELVPIKKQMSISYLTPQDIIVPPTEEFLRTEERTIFKNTQEVWKIQEEISRIKTELKALPKDSDEKEELIEEIKKLKEKKEEIIRSKKRDSKGIIAKRQKLGELRAELEKIRIEKDKKIKQLEYKIVERKRLLFKTLHTISDDEVVALEGKVENLKKKSRREKVLEVEIDEIRKEIISSEEAEQIQRRPKEAEPRFISYPIKFLRREGTAELVRNGELYSVLFEGETSAELFDKSSDEIIVKGNRALEFEYFTVKGRIVGEDDENYIVQRLSNDVTDRVSKTSNVKFISRTSIKDSDYSPVNYFDERFPIGTWISYKSYDTVFTGEIGYISVEGNAITYEKKNGEKDVYQIDDPDLFLTSKLKVGETFFKKDWINHMGVVIDFSNKGITVRNLNKRTTVFIPYPDSNYIRGQYDPIINEISEPPKRKEKEKLVDLLNSEVPDNLRDLVKSTYLDIFKRGLSITMTKSNEETGEKESGSGREFEFFLIPKPVSWTNFVTMKFQKWFFNNVEGDLQKDVDVEKIKREVEEKYRTSSNVNFMLDFLNSLIGDNLFRFDGYKFAHSDLDLIRKLRELKKPNPQFRMLCVYFLSDLASGALKRKKALRGRELGKEIYRIYLKYLEKLIVIKQSEVSYKITENANEIFTQKLIDSFQSKFVSFMSVHKLDVRSQYLQYLRDLLALINAFITGSKKTQIFEIIGSEILYFEAIKEEAKEYGVSEEEVFDGILNQNYDKVSQIIGKLNKFKDSREKEARKRRKGVQAESGIEKKEEEEEDIRLESLVDDFQKFENDVYERHKVSTKEYLEEIMYPYVFLGTPIAKYCKFFRAKFFSGKVDCSILSQCKIAEFFPELSMNLEITDSDWILISQLLFNARSVAIHNTCNLFYSLVVPTMKLKTKTYNNTDISLIGSLVVEPREICMRDTRTGTVKFAGDIKEIPDADLVICADKDGNFSCHSSEALIQQFKRKEYINHVTGEKYSKEFIERMMRRTGMTQEVEHYFYPVAERVGLGKIEINVEKMRKLEPDIDWEERALFETNNILDLIFENSNGHITVNGHDVQFIQSPELVDTNINLYAIDLEKNDIRDIQFVGKNDHMLVWNAKRGDEQKLREKWIRDRPFVKSITFVDSDYEDYDVLLGEIVKVLKRYS